MSSKKLMVIDTDCGVDDALALLMALTHQHEWDILAITSCSGNATLHHTTQNILRVLNFFEAQIPVYVGCDRSLLGEHTKSHHFQSDGFGGVGDQFPTGERQVEEAMPACVALTTLAKQHSGLVTLVALGPLTNLALALRLDPDFTKHLHQLVIMGGNSQGRGNLLPACEFNFGYDPEAAHIVLSEAACPLTIVPLETCVEHAQPWSWYDRWLQIDTNKAHFTRTILEQPVHQWREVLLRPKFACCDLLAMACVLYPEVVTTRKPYLAAVETHGQHTRGMLVLDRRPIPKPDPNISLVKTLNLELLQDIYIKLLVQ